MGSVNTADRREQEITEAAAKAIYERIGPSIPLWEDVTHRSYWLNAADAALKAFDAYLDLEKASSNTRTSEVAVSTKSKR